MSVTWIGTTIIDIALELELKSSVAQEHQTSKGSLGEPRISVLRCLAKSRHLDNIISGVERIACKRVITKLHVSVTGRDILVDDGEFFAVTVCPITALLRLRSRLLSAIAPGLEDSRGKWTADAPWFRAQPVFIPEFVRERILPFSCAISRACVYELDDSRAVARRVLWSGPT